MGKAKKEVKKPRSRKSTLKQMQRIAQNVAVLKSVGRNESSND